jgi:lipoate-protein ligase B
MAVLNDLGFVEDYKIVWDFQKQLLERRIANLIPDSVIFVEHAHVLTLGRSSHPSNILVKDLPIYEIERGGDVTYHGPGQLVVYPIVSLQDSSLSVRQYVERLEDLIIDSLSEFGLKLEGKLGQDTGVWVNGTRKIASIGVASSHWVTYHGFALNINTDLSYFDMIRPCGFESKIMTSLSKELGRSIELQRVKDAVKFSFSKKFGLEFEIVTGKEMKIK